MLVGVGVLPQLCASLVSVPVDCDEVFNYWEPLHHLLFSHGLQTWEYSPRFALRPYLYLLLHRLPAALLHRVFSKPAVFRILRVLLTVISVFCQFRLCTAVAGRWGRGTARIAWLLFAITPGILQANGSLLPNSLSMYLMMLLWAHHLEGADLRVVLIATVIGTVGWPYALLSAIIPLVSTCRTRLVAKDGQIVAVPSISWSRWIEILLRRWSAVLPFALVYVLLPTILIDRIYYGRWTVTPWNALTYNLLAPRNAGPAVFGTEPASFLVKNLLLNFTLLLPLALLAMVVDRSKATSKMWITWTGTVAIFSRMAHKEERFLYPIYPLIIVLSAVAVRRLGRRLGLLAILLCALLGYARFVALVRNHRGSVSVLGALDAGRQGTLCMADNWHRFPSHFYLPSTMRVAFLRIGFQGILPQYFVNSTNSTATPFNHHNLPMAGQFLEDKGQCDLFYGTSQELAVLGLEGEPLECRDVVVDSTEQDGGIPWSIRRWLCIPMFPPRTRDFCIFGPLTSQRH